MVKTANAGDARRLGLNPWVRRITWGKKWQPIPVFLPGKFHGQEHLVDYSPWGRKESDMTDPRAHIISVVFFLTKRC